MKTGEKNEKVEVKSIRLNLAGTTVDLTIQQAKELQEMLNKTFGHQFSATPHFIETIREVPVFVDRYPQIAPTPFWGTPIVTGAVSPNGDSRIEFNLTN